MDSATGASLREDVGRRRDVAADPIQTVPRPTRTSPILARPAVVRWCPVDGRRGRGVPAATTAGGSSRLAGTPMLQGVEPETLPATPPTTATNDRPALPERCPGCGLTLRGAITWCPTCFTDLTPAPPQAAAPQPVAAEPSDGADDHPPATDADADAALEAAADRMLAALAASERSTGGLWSRVPGTRGARAAVGAAGFVAVCGIALVAMLLLGHLV
ncbi:hypothetical protein GCM10028814_33560 [Angustibacter aerolatus]